MLGDNVLLACEGTVKSQRLNNEMKRLNYPRVSSVVVVPQEGLITDTLMHRGLGKIITENKSVNSLVTCYNDMATRYGRDGGGMQASEGFEKITEMNGLGCQGILMRLRRWPDI